MFNTPLRYPGGKGKITSSIRLLLEHNGLVGSNYIEPYAGGAGVAINLLLENIVSSIHINDLNFPVYCFWETLKNNPEYLCKKIKDTDISMDEWYRQNAIFKNYQSFDIKEIAFSTFFLNRTNRSGILQAGVIGGKKQAGIWKLDTRFNKENLIRRIEKIGSFSEKIKVTNLDAKDLIKNISHTCSDDSFIYMDPPYYKKGKGLYQNFYEHKDHLLIAELIQTSNIKNWIVSYDHNFNITEFYKNKKNIIYNLSYTAQQKYKGAEVIFFSDNVDIPKNLPLQVIEWNI
ncbi:DNA adenine methylase [Acinetobacter baumannii]|nr:DNA adenine methylase [Acinetobacter baumannii]MDC5546317.1 DNA adenine methylase [Acinetobacter baumannii]